MHKKDLLDKIKDLQGLTKDEKAYLVNLVNTKKKYGLVWEDKIEDVEEQLRTQLPVLKEVKERALISDNLEAPNHILIEGDNLHALTALTFTHEGKIDVIYIDPPYNTGNKDFIYNDHYVDKEDGYRHSKWLSFMEKRLKIAKRLLSETGVIFISIDDNEQAQLTLLCNEIFGELNAIGILPTIMNLKGNQDQFGFAGTHEYTFVYAKNKKVCQLNNLPYDPEELEKWKEDEIGFYKKGATLRATGAEDSREDRPGMFYPILYKEEMITSITQNEFDKIYDKKTKKFDDSYIKNLTKKYEEQGFGVVWPMKNKNDFGRWRWNYSLENKQRLGYDGILNTGGKKVTVYKKQRPSIGDIPSKKPKSLFYRPEYSSGNGTTQLKNILGKKIFDNPKPVDLLKDIIRIAAINPNSFILDFFAGSGTTLEALISLNEFDTLNYKGILVTNNENKIAEEVTYERNKRIIQGYTNSKGEKVIGLTKNNLRYYKTDFVSRKVSLANKRKLTRLATELLCIKEDCYTEVTSEINAAEWNKLITNAKGDYVYIIYDDLYVEDAVEALETFIKEKNIKTQIKVYVFANGQYAYAEEFEEVAENITLAALPDAIYKAYQNILPNEEREEIPELEEEPEELNESGQTQMNL